jgi:hypothetical protein
MRQWLKQEAVLWTIALILAVALLYWWGFSNLK